MWLFRAVRESVARDGAYLVLGRGGILAMGEVSGGQACVSFFRDLEENQKFWAHARS